MTQYNLIAKQFRGLNHIVVRRTLRDSLILLGVPLDQPTEFRPMQVVTDTGDIRGAARQRVKRGRVPANRVMRTLQIDNRTRLTQVLVGFGRMKKTLYTPTCVDDGAKRRNTLTQLNGGERHRVARGLFSGNAANAGSAAKNVRKVNWARSARCSTLLFCGTPSKWRLHWSSYVKKVFPCAMTMSRDSRR